MKEAKVLKMLRFHETLTLKQANYYSKINKSVLKRVLKSLIKNGLVKKEGKKFSLTPESDYWLGWHQFNN